MNKTVDSNNFFKPIKQTERVQFLDKEARLDVWSSKRRFSIGISYEKLDNLDEIIQMLVTSFDRVKDPLTTEELEQIRTTAPEKYEIYQTKQFVKREEDLKQYDRY